MRFHLVDRIDQCIPGDRIQARKLTSHGEDFWRGEPGDLAMPTSLVLESLCQAGAWLVWATTAGRSRATLAAMEGMAVATRRVRPGDVLEIAAALESITDEAAILSGAVFVEGDEVLRAERVMCVLVDPELLEDPELTRARERRLLAAAVG